MPKQNRLLTDLAAIEQQLTQLIRAASLLSVAPTVAPDDPANQAHNATWTPSIDIYETTGEFILTAEVPGVKNSDIDIKVIQETLVLRGERRWEPEADHELYHRLESSYGKFERSFSLSESIDAERITAELEHGVLKVSLPKRPMLSGQTQFEIPVRTDRG